MAGGCAQASELRGQVRAHNVSCLASIVLIYECGFDLGWVVVQAGTR